MPNETILKKVQAGLETVRGTDVAATRKVYARTAVSYERPLGAMVDTTGTFSGRRRPVYGRQRVGFTFNDLLTFEDWAWWLQLCVKGGVTGVSDAHPTAPAFTYTFVPTLQTDDLKSATLEFGEAGNPYQSTQVMVDGFSVRIDGDAGEAESGWMLDATAIGRDLTPTAYTASIPDRTTEVIQAKGAKVFIDNGGGTIGTTQVSGRLISVVITGANALNFKAFLEDETAFAANKVGRGLRAFDASLVMEFDNDTEFANLRATSQPVQRLIRLEREGSQIHPVSSTPALPATNKRARIDLMGYWSGWSEGDRNGNMIATYNLMAFYDAVAGYDARFEVVNALATLP